eukprot:TRINITY_DN55509_c0_g1_i1.p1 TRINITY_DN55509_c0_g1~~TRINITY_DN55509_c0_g1_i1.p1  ORF type:complete len:723 (-),score=104.76 TRINITY_DN55509_c0_g1_i1:118-2190(-)
MADKPNSYETYTLLPTSSVDVADDRDAAAQTEVPVRRSAYEETLHRSDQFDKWLDGKYTIVPEGNAWLDIWDTCVMVALLFTASWIPFEVSLCDGAPPGPILLMTKVFDCIFVIDIVLTFNVAYVVSGAAGIAQALDPYERRPLAIARYYMSFPFTDGMRAGWFWPDLCTVIPWEDMTSAEKMRSVRIVRVFRLVRMLRLVRVIKFFKRCQMSSGVSFSFLTILKCFGVALLLVHWLACFWAHLGKLPHHPGATPEGEEATSWLSVYRAGLGHKVEDLSALQIYADSLYWTTVVLTTVGFGDVTPKTGVEVVLTIAIVFCTGITWAWVVANVVNVITNSDVFGTQFNQVMDDVNSELQTCGINRALRLRIRRHIHESFDVQRRRHHQHALHWLSQGLQGELAIATGMEQVLNKIWYFQELDLPVMIELADEFKGQLFSPNEMIMDFTSASVIMRGSCIRRGRMLTRDAVIGEDVILVSLALRDMSSPRTLTFVETMSIHREKMREACIKFPDFDRRMRRAQIKLAMWRSFVLTARQRKNRMSNRAKSKKSVNVKLWEEKFFGMNDDDAVIPCFHAASWPVWSESFDKGFGAGTEPWQEAYKQFTESVDEHRRKDSEALQGGLLALQAENRAHRDSVDKRLTAIESTLQVLAASMQGLTSKLQDINGSQVAATPSMTTNSPHTKVKMGLFR